MRRLFLTLVATAAAAPLSAQNVDSSLAPIELLGAERLSCRFGPGTTVGWSTGAPVPGAAEWTLAPIVIEAIDLKNGSARIAESGETLNVLPTDNGVHFYQFDPKGTLTITTVSSARDPDGRYLAVVSRHAVGPGGESPAQYYGSCERAESENL